MPAITFEENRFIYKSNPLIEVICQLRFPTILRINYEPPADFQDLLRSKTSGRAFPNYRLRSEHQIPNEVAAMISSEMGGFLSPIHDFVTADGKWTVSLNKEFVSLSTTDYWRWEEYEEELNHIIAAVEKVYAPSHFTRIGLRYRNVIRPSRLKIAAPPWNQYLAKHILGELSGPEADKYSFEMAFRKTLMKFNNAEGKVLLQHGLAVLEGELSYMIDTDVYTDNETESKNAIEKIRNFRRESKELFRWCITEDLHNAMAPVSPDDAESRRTECA